MLRRHSRGQIVFRAPKDGEGGQGYTHCPLKLSCDIIKKLTVERCGYVCGLNSIKF